MKAIVQRHPLPQRRARARQARHHRVSAGRAQITGPRQTPFEEGASCAGQSLLQLDGGQSRRSNPRPPIREDER
jgi:hypothetical protein